MAQRSRPEMHLVLSDQHIPYQDRGVESLTLDFIREHKPDAIHLLGDVLDFYTLSRFDKDPARSGQLQDDLDQGCDYINRIRRHTRAPLIWSEGNHENRLRRYLWGTAPALAGLRSLRFEDLLRLAEFKINWAPAMKPYKVGKLLFTHGELVRKWSGMTAKGHYEKYGCSVIHGHTHRLGSFYHSTYENSHGAWENGCLCELSPEYMVSPDWQNGWSVVWFYGDYFHVEQVCVSGGQYVYHGGMRKLTEAAAKHKRKK